MARASAEDRLRLQTRPERGLKVTFLALTLVMAVSGLINLYLSHKISESHNNQIEILQKVGEQRVLCQNVRNDAKALVKANSIQSIIQAQQKMGRALIQLEISNMKLFSKQTFNSDTSRTEFLKAYAQTKSKFSAFDSSAQALVGDLDTPQRIQDHRQTLKNEEEFDTSVDKAMLDFGSRLRHWERQEQSFSTAILGANLVFVLAFGLFFFYPSIKRVAAMVDLMRRLQKESDEYQVELQERQKMLEESQASIEQTNRMLTAQKEALVEASEQLQAMTDASQASARRFEELFQAIPVACMGFDREGIIYDWNREAAKSFGYEAFEVLHRTIWEFFSGDDLNFATKLVRLVFSGRAYHNVEVRFPHRNGDLRYYLISIFPIRDQYSQVIGAISACMDITESKNRQDEIERNAKTFKSVITSLEESLIMIDQDSKVVIANENACRFLRMDHKVLVGSYLKDFVMDTCNDSGEPMEASKWPIFRTLKTGKPLVNQVLGVTYPGLPRQWININTVPVLGHADEGTAGVVVSFTDITEKRLQDEALLEAYSRLEALASTDGLTGLYNHRTFHEKLEKTLASEEYEDVSLILMDVDHFKQYNDSFGHPAGDFVLKSVAQLIKSACPEGAIAARYGGEEFAVILPGSLIKSASVVAEGIRVAVESNSWPLREVTLSLGVISARCQKANSKDLIAGADQALYTSKRAGRNRVTIDGQKPEFPDRRKAA